MSNELIKKSWEDHKGVWPYGDNEGMVAATKNIEQGEGCVYERCLQSKRMVDANGTWHWVGTKADFDAYGESLKEEWMPEVEKECLVTIDEFYLVDKECVPKYLGDVVVFEADGEEFGCKKESAKFRPIKSDEEKQADKVFDIVKDSRDLYHACELLIKEGVIDLSAHAMQGYKK